MKPYSLGDVQFRRFGRATDALSVRIESAEDDATAALKKVWLEISLGRTACPWRVPLAQPNLLWLDCHSFPFPDSTGVADDATGWLHVQ